MGEWKNNEGSDVEERDVPSMTSGMWNPANRARQPGFAITEDEDEDEDESASESESTEDLAAKSAIGCNRPRQPFGPVDIILFRSPTDSSSPISIRLT